MSAFNGMSMREMDGMPYLVEADLAKLGFGTQRVPAIARAQEAYVREVFDRCPSWRWRKRRKLALALQHALRVREIVEGTRT